jgi:hypothetical protein
MSETLEKLVDIALVGVSMLAIGVSANSIYSKVIVEEPIQEIQQEVQQSIPKQAMPWEKYELENFPEYNALLPTIYNASKEHNVPLENLAIITLTESKGKGGERYEPDFQRKYIEHWFDENSNRFVDLYNKLYPNKETSVEDFKKQLATSVGAFQIMCASAVDLYDKEENKFIELLSFDDLKKPEVNAHYAALYLRKKLGNDVNDLDKSLRIYNTGSATGTPHPGYLDRAEQFKKLLKVK